jgi:hypothetical protein
MSHCSEHTGGETPGLGGPQPDWYDPARLIMDLDVAALLATGEHPLERVKAAVAASAPDQIVQLRSPFPPSPLLALFAGAGMRVWCGQEGALYRTCICKP